MTFGFTKDKIPKAYKKIRRKRKCDWCGYTTKLDIHRECVPRPDYHDHEAFWAWMKSPVRPTREGRKTMRELTQEEREKLDEIELDTVDYTD